MKFCVITHVTHKIGKEANYAYGPYVREMNLWFNYVSEVRVVAPMINQKLTSIDLPYKKKSLKLIKVPAFNFTSVLNAFHSILVIPIIKIKIVQSFFWADHIHIRCPGNMGLLACFIQIFFPKKPKTVKYAGNWDPNSKQPLSYKLQKWILGNTFLTKNCKVLVYGEWPNQSKNILPFFTASYSKQEIIPLSDKTFDGPLQFLFVGTFSKGKQPLLSVQVIEKLKRKGLPVLLHMFGEGEVYNEVKDYVSHHDLNDTVILHGNQSSEVVKSYYQQCHFLIFISISEGWPKVVAEAMFWKCLPISTRVSCVPYMLGNGERGLLVENNISQIEKAVEELIDQYDNYKKMVKNAQEWSQQFTLEYFDEQIKNQVLQ